MRVAKRWPELEANPQTSADLSVDGALKMLSASSGETRVTSNSGNYG